jgi:hypothetical protein
MTGTEIYKRTPTYERAARNIRLHAPHWKLLLAFDGQRSLAEVALSAEVSFAEALPLTERFLGIGWLEEQPISLDQYLKRTGAPDVTAIGASIPPATVLHGPKTKTAPLPTITASAPPAIPASSTTPPPMPAPAGRGPMRLSAVVDFIISTAANYSLGQLLVYRVFLRVPLDLLQAEEIASVHLVNDTSVIKTPELQEAISQVVQEVVKRALPDSVFATAPAA